MLSSLKERRAHIGLATAVFAVLAALALTCPSLAHATSTYTAGDGVTYTYSMLNGGGVFIKGATSDHIVDELVIPGEIAGEPVREYDVYRLDVVTGRESTLVSIRQIDFSHAPELKSANAYAESVDLAGNKKLESLRLSVDEVAQEQGVQSSGTLDLGTCTKLESLYLGTVAYKKIDVSSCKNLRTISGNTNLAGLDLRKCSSLESVSFGSDENSKPMRVLFAGNRKLKKVEFSGRSIVEQLDFRGCTNLEEVRVTECSSLKGINFSGCANLKDLVCVDTKKLSKITNLGSCKKLEVLSISGTIIGSMNTAKFKNLLYLDVSNTPIKQLDLSKNTELEYLCCTGAKVAKLDLRKNKWLLAVKCDKRTKVNGFEKIEGVDFEGRESY